MTEDTYHEDDVCIVGIGCLFPDAKNPEAFWRNISRGVRSIRELPKDRFDADLYFDSDKKAQDKSYTRVGAIIENSTIERTAKKLGMSLSEYNRLHIIALEAATQALSCVSLKTLKRDKKKTAAIFGCMDIDDFFMRDRFYLHHRKKLSNYVRSHHQEKANEIMAAFKKSFSGKNQSLPEKDVRTVLTTSVIDCIKKRFDFRGEGFLVDAACASSLAAIDTATAMLRRGDCDLALSGGFESNLSPSSFVLFSKVGAMSEKGALPFDISGDGISQGEGSAMFVLQRLGDALRDGNKIYGVIRGIGGSSDGRESSLFSPSLSGQLLAYERAYAGLDKNRVDYIECHGTGTKVGDAMEAQSVDAFWDGRKLPIGSVKALIGHTKGAAGSAGLLKTILIMAHHEIPASSYIRKPLLAGGGAYVNRKSIKIERKHAMRIGISSFGFGNTNFHLVLDEFHSKSLEGEKNSDKKDKEVVLIARAMQSCRELDQKVLATRHVIASTTLAHSDRIQLCALAAFDKALSHAGLHSNDLSKDNVSVVAASILCLQASEDFEARVRFFEFQKAFSFLTKDELASVIHLKDEVFTSVTEDTGPGILNNVIAGRMCNTFDFKGKNFNIDADLVSRRAALAVIHRELSQREGVVILLSSHDRFDRKSAHVNRSSVTCEIFSNLPYAKEHNYPIAQIVKKITYHE